MGACEHCQFGSSAKRALAILVARNSNWHICRQVSVLTDVSGSRREAESKNVNPAACIFTGEEELAPEQMQAITADHKGNNSRLFFLETRHSQ